MKIRLAMLLMLSLYAATVSAGVAWQPWSAAAFSQAKMSRKPVFLYLEATWCHWCHVMQATTLVDDDVKRLLKRD